MDSTSNSGKQQPPDLPTTAPTISGGVVRLRSQDLFAHVREVEIDHGGRIYKLRVTQQNKLILTA